MGSTNKKSPPFHLFVPKWMIKLIEQKQCSRCNTPVRRKHIQAVGVREMSAGGEFAFFAEYRCPECDYAVCTNFTHEKTGNLEDLCYAMIEQMHKNKQLQRAKKSSKNTNRATNISDSEMRKCIQFVQNTKTHEEFMKFIGADNIIPNSDAD